MGFNWRPEDYGGSPHSSKENIPSEEHKIENLNYFDATVEVGVENLSYDKNLESQIAISETEKIEQEEPLIYESLPVLELTHIEPSTINKAISVFLVTILQVVFAILAYRVIYFLGSSTPSLFFGTLLGLMPEIATALGIISLLLTVRALLLSKKYVLPMIISFSGLLLYILSLPWLLSY